MADKKEPDFHKSELNLMALILGQYRHLYAHLGNINAVTIMRTGKWPRVVCLDGDLTQGLYE